MIVYNVERQFFTEKLMADAYRIARGLRPSALLKIRVDDREQLATLLNALCDPPAAGKPVPAPATPELVDRAYVAVRTADISNVVPKFLIEAWDKLK